MRDSDNCKIIKLFENSGKLENFDLFLRTVEVNKSHLNEIDIKFFCL